MAAKKTSKNTGPAKAAKKTAAKAASKKTVAKKVTAKKAVKKATAKKAAAKKTAAKKVATKAVGTKSVAKKVTAKAEVKKEAAPKVRRNSLTGAPIPPPAPVKPPFVPPKTEKAKRASSGSGKHTAAFIKKQEQRLLDLRDTLVDSMTGTTRDTIRKAPEGSEASGSGQHQGDAGSDAYDRDFALSVLASEQDALYEVDQALKRIEAGTYGQCEISGHKIPTLRLEAIPFARLTVECQAEWEKEHGTKKFRPSSEVGFSGGGIYEDEDSESISLDGDDD